MAPDFFYISLMSGEELRTIRKALKLSQAAMARQLGYADYKRISRYERADVLPDDLVERVISLASRRVQERAQKRSEVTQLLEFFDAQYAS